MQNINGVSERIPHFFISFVMTIVMLTINYKKPMKRFIVLFTISFLLISPQFAQTNTNGRDNFLKVKGIAVLKQVPEILSVRITIKVTSDQYNPCQEKLIRAIDQAKKVFIQQGIEKKTIIISQLNIAEKTDYLPDGLTKTGYEGSTTLVIENPFSEKYAKKILSALHNDSVSMLYNLDFILSEDQKKELRQKAIGNAVEDAREKAESIAAASKVRLLNIKSINFTEEENGHYYDSDLVQENVLMARGVAMKSGDSQLPVIDFNPRETGIKKSVTMEWWIEDLK